VLGQADTGSVKDLRVPLSMKTKVGYSHAEASDARFRRWSPRPLGLPDTPAAVVQFMTNRLPRAFRLPGLLTAVAGLALMLRLLQ
jgi:hypothetical protein